MTAPAKPAAVRVIQGLLVLGLSCSVAALVLPSVASILASIGVGSMLAAACVRLPLAALGWRQGSDRRFLLAATALLVVIILGALIGQIGDSEAVPR